MLERACMRDDGSLKCFCAGSSLTAGLGITHATTSTGWRAAKARPQLARGELTVPLFATLSQCLLVAQTASFDAQPGLLTHIGPTRSAAARRLPPLLCRRPAAGQPAGQGAGLDPYQVEHSAHRPLPPEPGAVAGRNSGCTATI